MAKKYKFYRLNNILKREAHYNVIFGERSSGKTYAVKERILREFFKTGKQGAIIRRWDDDLRGVRGTVMFDDQLDLIERLSKGGYNSIMYQSRRWYMVKRDESGQIVDKNETPFCYGFGLNVMEHDKSTSYPNVKIIMFDEFLTRGVYLKDEFVIFMNVISTIARHRKEVEIYMLGNTVNKYCPYFAEMGLDHVKQMKPGDIDLYRYGKTELKVAVEYTGNLNSDAKASNILFAFNNSKLQMVTHGSWEIDIYPHLPLRYTPKNVLFSFFVLFDGETVQGDIIGGGFKQIGTARHEIDSFPFIYFHIKTTEIQKPERDYIISTEVKRFPNWHRSLLHPTDRAGERILKLIKMEKVFYQTNEVGEIINNFKKWEVNR